MRFASDINGNLICASDPVDKYEECFCRACGEKLKHKKGDIYKPYFAHKPDTTCSYGKDADNKSEWHIRMQDYFINNKKVEHLFIDENTGERHIADVYDPKSNIILEFQKSHIDYEEFFKRTSFHIANGRKIAWLFDESAKENKYFGRLKPDDLYAISTMPLRDIYKGKSYKWLRNPRQMLNSISNIQGLNDDNFAAYIFSGTEGDIFHRIIKQDYGFEYITLSVHDIVMKTEMDFNEFFVSEQRWLQEEPYKSIIDNYNKLQVARNLAYQQQQAALRRTAFNSLVRGNGRRGRL